MKAGKFIRILCEGESTEPKYFRSILKRKRLSNGRVVKPKDNSPLGIVRAAKELKEEAQKAKIPADDIHIWTVFDRDRHPKIKEALVMAKDNGINVAFSNTCFEFWILLHFEKCTKPFGPCDEVLSYLKKKHIPNYSKSTDYSDLLRPLIPTAIDNNKWLIQKHWAQELEGNEIVIDLNPFSNVYCLVEFLFAE